ncbi:MAG: N-formylglutamate amidohydrolase [Pseudomonadota bacterium]|nr:N-formylglutamate amidohydrolase [Pseudomonadota bacterium]
MSAASVRRRSRWTLVVTCEHGGNRIPAEYRALFRGDEKRLASHLGFDLGALTLAQELSRQFKAPLVASTVSRLLVELNRSPGHRALYSDRTRALPEAQKARIIARHYEPFRREVLETVRSAVHRCEAVFHLSSHSFTPVLAGETRTADVGILYDPKRVEERRLCRTWSASLGSRIAPLRVRRNYPYRGYNDGLTTYLRRLFPEHAYVGVELEVNQKHPRAGGQHWRTLRREIIESIGDLLQHSPRSRT